MYVITIHDSEGDTRMMIGCADKAHEMHMFINQCGVHAELTNHEETLMLDRSDEEINRVSEWVGKYFNRTG